MTREDVNDILLEMSNAHIDNILLSGNEPIIENEEDLSVYTLEELIEELEYEEEIDFNI